MNDNYLQKVAFQNLILALLLYIKSLFYGLIFSRKYWLHFIVVGIEVSSAPLRFLQHKTAKVSIGKIFF